MRTAPLAYLAYAAASFGCAGNVSDAPGDAETGTTTAAVVVVERTTDGAQGTRAEGTARFARVSLSTSVPDALRLIGAALDLPARGACAVSSLDDATAPRQAAPVELLDVGAVSLQAGGAEMRLLPRQLPDVTDVVSGVVYDRAVEGSLLPTAPSYTVHVAGAGSLPSFDVTASAPGDPALVQITGETTDGTLVVSGQTLDLTWTPSTPDDIVYADIRPNGVRCVFADTGHASVPTVFFDDDGAFVIHRLHREALRAPGIDSGEVRFDFARSMPYVRR